MNTRASDRGGFEFWIPEIDTLVLVEPQDDAVIVRATRNSFSERRKISFIRELAAEGFIPEHYQWFSGSGLTAVSNVRWRVDASWLKLDPAMRARSNALMARLLIGVGLLWFGLMAALFLR